MLFVDLFPKVRVVVALLFGHHVFFVKGQLVLARILGRFSECFNVIMVSIVSCFEFLATLGLVDGFFIFVEDGFCFLEFF